jgi:hypothetical protein
MTVLGGAVLKLTKRTRMCYRDAFYCRAAEVSSTLKTVEWKNLDPITGHGFRNSISP